MNIIFNELRQQPVKYVHTTSKIKSMHAIFYHILFLLLIYFNWNNFVMRSNTIRRAWLYLLSKGKQVKISLSVDAYTIAKFICTILCSAYTTTKSRLFFPILLRAAWQCAWRDVVCSADGSVPVLLLY